MGDSFNRSAVPTRRVVKTSPDLCRPAALSEAEREAYWHEHLFTCVYNAQVTLLTVQEVYEHLRCCRMCMSNDTSARTRVGKAQGTRRMAHG